MSLLLIGIRSPDREANLRYAEALTQKLRALPPTVVSLATYDVRDVRDFFEKNKWLLRLGGRPGVDPRSAAQRDQQAQEPAVRPARRATSRSTRCRSASSGTDGLDERFPGGIFSQQQRRVRLDRRAAAGRPVRRARRARRSTTRPSELIKNDPAVALSPADDGRGLGPDRHRHRQPRRRSSATSCWSPITCLVIVALSIGLYFRRLRAIPLTGIPAAIGAADGLRGRRAGLRLPQLVDGVPGVDHHRQRHQLRHRPDVPLRGAARARRGSRRRRWRARWRGVWRGTLVAAISASAAYASLMVTSFRGFYQFGVMGAVGALACWLATFTVLPALLVLLDRRAGRRRAGRRARRARPAGAAPRAAQRRRDRRRSRSLAIVGAVRAARTSCRTRSSTTSAS